MREVVAMSAGGGGLHMLDAFIDAVSSDIPPGPDTPPHPLFTPSQASPHAHTARCVLYDGRTDAHPMLHAGLARHRYTRASMAMYHTPAGSNWAKGGPDDVSVRSELIHTAIDTLASQLEACDAPGGVLHFAALGGETGGVRGGVLTTHVHDAFPTLPLLTAAALPTPRHAHAATEAYHAVLALHALCRGVRGDTCVVLLDGECTAVRGGGLAHGDRVAMRALADATTPALTPHRDTLAGATHSLRALTHALTPFAGAPLAALTHAPHAVGGPIASDALVGEMWREGVALLSSDGARALCETRVFSGVACVHGTRAHARTWANAVRALTPAPTLPHGVLPCAVHAREDTPTRAAALVSGDVCSEPLQRLHAQFHTMFSRRAFLHVLGGDAETELREAGDTLRTLMDTYRVEAAAA